jgi:hypothetical protein
LRDADVILVVCVISDNGVNNGLENVLLRNDTVHVLYEIIGFVDFVVLEVVDYKVESRLWEDFDERRENLKSVLAAPKNNKVVSQEVALLKYLAAL